MKVLILLANCESSNVFPLLALGRQLARIGIQIIFALCDASTCGGCQRLSFDIPDVGCLQRRLELKKLASQRGFKAVSISRFIKRELQVDITYTGSTRLKPSSSYRHLDIWDICKGSVFRYLQRTYLLPGDEPVVELFCTKGAMLYEAWLALISEYYIDSVVVFQGMPYVDRLAAEAANSLDVSTFSYENSCFKSLKFFVPGNFVVNRHPLSTQTYWDTIKDRRLSPEESERLAGFLKKVYSGEHNQIRQGSTESLTCLFERFQLSRDRKIILVLGQVPFDSVITYDSPHYPETILFFEDIINVAEGLPEYDFVLRFHPLEGMLFGNRTFKNLAIRKLPSNVRLIHSHQANTYQLMDISTVGVVINSQTGLEMAAKGKRVVVCGNAFYAGKGFTTELNGRESLGRVILEAATGPVSDAVSNDRLELFLYHFIFEYLKKYEEDEGFSETSIKAITELLLDSQFNPIVSSVAVESRGGDVPVLLEDGETGSYEKALQLLSDGLGVEAARKFPCLESSRGNMLLGGPLKIRSLLSNGQADEAVTLSEKLLENHPDDFYILGEAIAAHNRVRDFATAKLLFSRHRERYPQSPWGVERYYSSLLEAGENKEVISKILAGIGEFPASAALRHILGLALLKSRMDVEAEAEFRAAIRLDPFATWPHFDLATLLARTGRHQESASEFAESIRLGLSSPGLHLDYGLVLFHLGIFKDALKQFQLCLNAKPISLTYYVLFMIDLRRKKPSLRSILSIFNVAVTLSKNVWLKYAGNFKKKKL